MQKVAAMLPFVCAKNKCFCWILRTGRNWTNWANKQNNSCNYSKLMKKIWQINKNLLTRKQDFGNLSFEQQIIIENWTFTRCRFRCFFI